MAPEVTLSTTAKPSTAELARLFAQATWAASRDEATIRTILDHTAVFVTVRKDGVLVGFGRALSDGACRALVDDVVVDTELRESGIGSRIMSSLMAQLEGIEEVFLNTGPALQAFYARFGFVPHEGLTMRADARSRQSRRQQHRR